MDGGGSHSAIMDVLARYGLFGGWIFIKMLFSVNLAYHKDQKEQGIFRILNATMSALLIVGILNTMPFQCMLPITIVLLSLLSEVELWRGKSNEGSLDCQHRSL